MGLFLQLRTSYLPTAKPRQHFEPFPFCSSDRDNCNIDRTSVSAFVYTKFRLQIASPVSTAVCRR